MSKLLENMTTLVNEYIIICSGKLYLWKVGDKIYSNKIQKSNYISLIDNYL